MRISPECSGETCARGGQEGVLPVVMREKAKFRERKIEPLNVRKDRQSLEGAQAMRDYKRTQEAVRERMAALRTERLARQAQEKEGA